MTEALSNSPFIHSSLLVHDFLYSSFTAKWHFIAIAVLVPGDENMYQIAPTSTDTFTS